MLTGIRNKELVALQAIAQDLLRLTPSQLQDCVENMTLQEICNDEQAKAE